MPIGPFSADFIQVEGKPAIEGATANLYAQEGARLRQEIETNSAKAEAQAKAPILATLYSDSLTKISRGDFSGFSDLSRATAESATNPFLASMAHDASSVAARMASEYLDTERAKLGYSAALEREKLGNAASLQRAQINADTSKANTQSVTERQGNKAYVTDFNKYKIDHAAWEQLPPEEKAKTPEPQQPDRALYDFSAGTGDLQNTGVPTASDKILQKEAKTSSVVEPPLPQKDIEQRNYSTEQDLANIQQKEKDFNKKFETLGFGNSNVKVIVPVLESKDGNVKTVKIGGVTHTFKDSEEDKARIKTINEDREAIKKMTGVDQDFVSWAGRMGQLGNAIEFKESGKGYTALARNVKTGEVQYWTDAQDVKQQDGGIIHVPAWDQRGVSKTLTKKDKELFDQGGAAIKRLVTEKLAHVDGLGSEELNKSQQDQVDKDSQAKYLAAKTDKDRENINAVRRSVGLSAITGSTKPIEIYRDEIAAKDKLLSDAGFKPTDEVSLTKVIDSIKGKFSDWNIERKKRAIVNMEQAIQEEKARLSSLDTKTQGGMANQVAKHIVSLEELKKEYEKDIQ